MAILNQPEIVKAYIDPGTGSMLFTILIGLISALVYGARGLIIKIRYSTGASNKKAIQNLVPFVIYSEGKRYWNSFELICDEFESRKIPVKFLTQSKDDYIFDKGYEYVKPEFIGEGNRGFTKLNFLKADVLLATTPGLDVYQWKRSKDVKYYVHILHSTGDVAGYRMFGLDYYDSVLVNNDGFQKKQIRELESIRPNIKRKEVKVVGLPYMDYLLKKVQSSKKEDKTVTTVLLAPSWGSSSIFNKYGSKILDELLKTGYHIIVRPHPQSFISDKEMIENLIDSYPNNEQIEWNRDSDNFDVLNKSDILISDFSGIIFDFALVFDKPVIYTETDFDYSPYDSWWLKEPYWWIFSVLPKIGERLSKDSVNNIKQLIDNCINDPKYKKGRDDVKKEGYHNIGNAAKSTVDYLIEKQKELRN